MLQGDVNKNEIIDISDLTQMLLKIKNNNIISTFNSKTFNEINYEWKCIYTYEQSKKQKPINLWTDYDNTLGVPLKYLSNKVDGSDLLIKFKVHSNNYKKTEEWFFKGFDLSKAFNPKSKPDKTYRTVYAKTNETDEWTKYTMFKYSFTNYAWNWKFCMHNNKSSNQLCWNHENSFLLFYKNPIKGASIFTNSDDEINGHKLWLDWDSIEVFVQKPFQITKN